jgi:predicted RNA-binding protein Jag
MENIFEQIKTLLISGGFSGVEMNVDEDHRKISFLIDDRAVSDHLTIFLPALDHILGLVLRKQNQDPFVIDVNYYRRERERLIAELARAAAKKAIVTKQDIELPPMNAYERRLVHMEITTHPELETESVGDGKERRVVIKRIN